MAKSKDQDQSLAIQEEIRARVFEKYAERQGVETQRHELQATLEALHDVTHIPMNEIEKIASNVVQEYKGSHVLETLSQEQLSHLAPARDLAFEKLQRRIEKNKRGFSLHLLAYGCVNIPLIILNMITTSFPWAMFPLLSWAIGLGSHFLAAVYWPGKDFHRKLQLLRSQIHQILEENVPLYRSEMQPRIFNGVYRLMVSEGSKEMLDEYIRNIDPQMPTNEINQVTTQLCAIRDKYIRK